MKTKLILTTIATVILTLGQTTLFAQGNNIDIRFLKAKFTDTTAGKSLVAVFIVSTIDSSSFPPSIDLPPKCTVFENGREKVVLLNQSMLSVTLDDENMPDKNRVVYDLIKDQVNLKTLAHALIITYSIKNLNYSFNKMSLTPAFKEKHNRDIRVDKRCEFTVQ